MSTSRVSLCIFLIIASLDACLSIIIDPNNPNYVCIFWTLPCWDDLPCCAYYRCIQGHCRKPPGLRESDFSINTFKNQNFI